jgi:CubicO group peptidase (beta-lactamase class C family)
MVDMIELDPNGIVSGAVAPGFEAVAAEFERNFTERGDVGAAFAAVHRGRMVVDIWGGRAAPGRGWDRDTMQVIFSGTKGLVAACMLILIERGMIDIDAPVVRYWPEFAQNGKDRVLIRHVVSHRAGLPGIIRTVSEADLTDDRKMERLLAAQELSRDPDAYNCYHALTIGWLCGAIIRRVDGRSLGRFFAEEIAGPLGLDAWIGLPDSEAHRVGQLELDPESPWNATVITDPVHKSIWDNPPIFPAAGLPWNTPSFHAAEIGGAGGIATARAMARYYGCLAQGGEIDGIRILKARTIKAGLRERARFRDPYLLEPMAYGTVFALQTEQARFGPPPDAFGHAGAGGSIHGGWPSSETGFSYTMNQMRVDPEDMRSRALLERLHAAL